MADIDGDLLARVDRYIEELLVPPMPAGAATVNPPKTPPAAGE